MKYVKASEVLPDKLLKQVQKYAEGCTLYIPKQRERKKWGESSGTREYYQQRNDEIRTKYAICKSVNLLADEYNLTIESIRKIIYEKR